MIYDTFDAWKIYRAIKMHFTSSYDYFKYHARAKNINWNVFTRDNSKRVITKLAHEYKDEYPDFIATSFAKNPESKWVGDFLEDDYKKNYLRKQKYFSATQRHFGKEIEHLYTVAVSNKASFRALFYPTDEMKLPAIVQLELEGLLSLETSAILHKLYEWGHKVNCSHPLWATQRLRIVKYAPFISVDLAKCKTTLLAKLNQNC